MWAEKSMGNVSSKHCINICPEKASPALLYTGEAVSGM
jgi:hypothetical protein